METEFLCTFWKIVRRVEANTGIDLPKDTEAYVVLLMAEFTANNNVFPDPSFAERYFQLSTPLEAKGLGDQCLFVTGWFPESLNRKGLGVTYIESIGKTCYIKAAEQLNNQLFEDLAVNFSFVRSFINQTKEELRVSPDLGDFGYENN